MNPAEVIKIKKLKRELKLAMRRILRIYYANDILHIREIDDMIDYCKEQKLYLRSILDRLDYFQDSLEKSKWINRHPDRHSDIL